MYVFFLVCLIFNSCKPNIEKHIKENPGLIFIIIGFGALVFLIFRVIENKLDITNYRRGLIAAISFVLIVVLVCIYLVIKYIFGVELVKKSG